MLSAFINIVVTFILNYLQKVNNNSVKKIVFLGFTFFVIIYKLGCYFIFSLIAYSFTYIILFV